MVRVLAVSDEEVAGLCADSARRLDVDLVVAAGDLHVAYLSGIVDTLDRPGVLVPGNHDPDISGFSKRAGMWMRSGQPVDWPGPAGFADAGGRRVPEL